MAAATPAEHKTLDRQTFAQTLNVPALRVAKQRCNELMKQLRGHTLDRPKLRCIVQEPGTPADAPHKLLLLSDTLDIANLPASVQQAVDTENCEVTTYDLTLDYSHLNADQVLKRVLPAAVEIPSSFETIGHIVHLNLRDEHMPYKYIIGQVIIDKNPHVRTVVNKVGSIDNEFRVFAMELLAGEDQMETELVQHGFKFRLNFSQVYWNSRLETEHKRLVERYFEPGHVVADIMAGIGPFAIPAAAHGCKVYANDLNPSSAKYMEINVKLNKVVSNVKVFNMDGRAFVRLLCDTPFSNHHQRTDKANATPVDAPPASQSAPQSTTTHVSGIPAPIPAGFSVPPGGLVFQHAVMNLPASAVEFLDAFNGAFDPGVWAGRLPLVHVYTFKTAAMTQQDVIHRVESYLGGSLPEPPTIHHVRDVAPNKIMLCVTFRVPEAVAFNGRQVVDQQEPTKKQKVDNSIA